MKFIGLFFAVLSSHVAMNLLWNDVVVELPKGRWWMFIARLALYLGYVAYITYILTISIPG